MSMIHRLMAVSVCVCIGAAGTAHASYIASTSATLIAAESETGNLYLVNTADASLTLLGNVGADRIGGLEFHGDTLYGLRTDYDGATLHTIDLDTLALSLVGDLGEGFFYEGSLCFDANGTAYATQRGFSGAPELLTINLDSGEASTVAIMNNGAHDINGLAYLDEGLLVGLDRVTNAIVSIDPLTADVQVLLSMPELEVLVGGVGGMTMDSAGLIWFVTSGPENVYPGSNSLYSYNPDTNVVSRIGYLNIQGTPLDGSGMSGLAYVVPEPSTMLLLIAGIGGLAMHRRRAA